MRSEERIFYLLTELRKAIPHPELGVGSQMFEYLSSMTPMINVDLLIKDQKRGVLMAWRDDGCGRGWHIPGGVVRFKETLETRIEEVIKNEIKVPLTYEKIPVQLEQVIMDTQVRGHFISLLYQCRIEEKEPFIKEEPPFFPGDLKWHKAFPKNMVRGQREFYRKYFDGGSDD